jgi:hypothetical protein
MNWLVELGVILFTFNALFGPVVAGCLAVLYLFWSAIRQITAYRMAKKLMVFTGNTKFEVCRNENTKKRK